MRKSTIYGIIWSFWLGYWLGSLGADLLTLKFWYIFLPIVVFVELEKNAHKNDE
jgi:hypothetical protein